MPLLSNKISALFGGLLFLTIPSLTQADTNKQVTIFAAASLTPTLTEVGKAFKESTGATPVFSFASSGSLARQISSGAPADIFISANKKWADWLKKNNPGLIQLERSLLTNRLALVMSKKHTPRPTSITELPLVITDQRIAIGDPNHVPAGIYAKQALSHFGLWQGISNNLAPSQNIRAALYLVQTQAAPFGIVYQSDLVRNKHIELIEIFPPESHDQIVYQSILLSSKPMGSAESIKFYDFLSENISKSIFEKFGFIPVD